MQDYSFGDKQYQREFILNYEPAENGSSLLLYYADNSIDYKKNTAENIFEIEQIMASQINRAHALLHNSIIDYSEVNKIEGIMQLVGTVSPEDLKKYDVNLLNEIKQFLAIKAKEKDIEKNKLILDNQEYFKQITQDRYLSQWVYGMPWRYQWRYMFGTDEEREISLTTADRLKLKEVQKVYAAAKRYSDSFYDLPKSEDLERKRVI